MAELLPEEIDALLERSEPLPPEFVAPAQMRFMSAEPDPPPVPLPLGTERRFFAQPPAPVNPLEDIRKQINAVQFKTAQEALDAATHFQALRAYQRDLEAGKDPTRWLPLLFKKNPAVIPGMMRERRMGAPVNVRNVGGYDVLSGGGGTPRVIPKPMVPGPVQGFPVRDENGAVLPDFIAVPSSTGRGMEVRLRRQERSQSQQASPSARSTYFQRQIDNIDTALRVLDRTEPAPTDADAQRTRLNAQKKEFEDALKELNPLPGKPTAAPASPSAPQSVLSMPKEKAKLEKDKVYQTPRGVARWDGEKFIAQ